MKASFTAYFFINAGFSHSLSLSDAVSVYEDDACCVLVTPCILNQPPNIAKQTARPLERYYVCASQVKVANLLKANVVVSPQYSYRNLRKGQTK